MANENFTLSRKELIEIAVLAVVLPLPVNWALLELNPLALVEGADDAAAWIGYGGSYIGGIIGGVISVLILNRTLQQTGALHRDLKILQLNTIRYTQQQEWFAGFKQNLADNLKAVDLYVLNMVVSCLNTGDFAYAKSLLTDINKRLEQQNVTSTFLFPSSVLRKKEREYMHRMRTIYLEYSALIKDLLFYIPLAETIGKGNEPGYDALIEYAMTQYDYLKEQNDSQHDVEGNLCSSVLNLNPDEPVGPALKRLVEMRLTMRTKLYRLKYELALNTKQLIKYEEKRINSILEENT